LTPQFNKKMAYTFNLIAGFSTILCEFFLIR